MADEREKPGLVQKAWDHTVDRIKAIPAEASDTLWNRTLPQGQSELAAALYAPGGSAYVAYGSGQLPLDPIEKEQDMQDDKGMTQGMDAQDKATVHGAGQKLADSGVKAEAKEAAMEPKGWPDDDLPTAERAQTLGQRR